MRPSTPIRGKYVSVGPSSRIFSEWPPAFALGFGCPTILRCVLASLYEVMSVRPSVRHHLTINDENFDFCDDFSFSSMKKSERMLKLLKMIKMIKMLKS